MSSSPELSFRRSYYSLWKLWLLALVSAVCLVASKGVAHLLADLLGIGQGSPVMAGLVRDAGLLGSLCAAAGITYYRFYSRYRVYPHSIEAKNGILYRHNSSANLSHIRSVDVKRTLMGMIMGYGDIHFGTAGTGEANVNFLSVSDPDQIKKRIEQLIHSPSEANADMTPID